MLGYMSSNDDVFCYIDSNDRFWLIDNEEELLMCSKHTKADKIAVYQEVFNGANLHMCYSNGRNCIFLTCKPDGVYYGDNMVLCVDELTKFRKMFGSETLDRREREKDQDDEQKYKQAMIEARKSEREDKQGQECSEEEEDSCPCPKCKDYNTWVAGHDEYVDLYVFIQNPVKSQIKEMPELVCPLDNDCDADKYLYKDHGLTFVAHDSKPNYIGLDGAHVNLTFPLVTWNKYLADKL